jgi:hypothetical protein
LCSCVCLSVLARNGSDQFQQLSHRMIVLYFTLSSVDRCIGAVEQPLLLVAGQVLMKAIHYPRKVASLYSSLLQICEHVM